jgi:two-component system, cell cycle sensor histidine kinase and response regulator CckA
MAPFHARPKVPMLEPSDHHTKAQVEAKCILVVEDEELVRDLAERVLALNGYRVLVAADGLAAVDTFRKHGADIDLVLLDLTMPGLSGAEVFAAMVAERPNTRVLVTSGYAEEEGQAMMRHPAVTGFLGKPYRIDRLLTEVQSSLDKQRH